MKTKPRKYCVADYAKIVEWSDEDKCFIGRCPDLFAGGIHGDNEATVYGELCTAVQEWLDVLETNKMPIPPASEKYSGKFVVRVSSALHQRLSLQAKVHHQSLNQFVVEKLSASGR